MVSLLNRAVLTAGALLTAQAAGAQGPAKSPPSFTVAVPAGFDDLVGDQHAVVDVYLGGRRVGDAEAVFSPGHFRFVSPATLIAGIEAITDHAAVSAALGADDLDPHQNLVCRAVHPAPECGKLQPQMAGIIFDNARYRVDLFINPGLLTVQAAMERDYLSAPAPGLSLVNGVGVALAGSAGHAAHYTVNDNLVLGIGSGRLRSDLSWSSSRALKADSLVAEVDRPGWRYAAGALWAPGNELVGRRKVLGLAVSTQLDTRTDRDQVEGVPLVVFLDQRSRVDVLVDHKLLASGLYDAGNQALDTSLFPEGSYQVVLHIVGINGAAREERRFFTRSSKVPPLGSDAWLALIGTMIDDGPGPLGHIGRAPFFQFGWAHRLSPGFAVNLGAMGTGRQHYLQLGATMIGKRLQIDTTALLSPAGDVGIYGHLASQPGGRLAFNLDARAVSSRDGRPLLPEAGPQTVYIGVQAPLAPLGSYAQVSGDVAYQLGRARFAITGSWRRANGASNYAAGPSFRLPLWRARHFEVIANGDYAFTSRGRGGYLGFSLLVTRGNKSFSAETGLRESPGGGHGGIAAVGNLRASLSGADVLGAEVQASAGLTHDEAATYAAAELTARNQLGDLGVSFTQPLSGPSPAQYALSFRTNLAAQGTTMTFGAAAGGESAIIAKVTAADPHDRFDVLVNDVPRASVAGGQSVLVQLPSYRSYAVRIRAAGTSLVGYDSEVRRVTLYPGNVAALKWQTKPQLAVFARLVGADGQPIAHADISTGANIAATDEAGTFLIQLDDEREIRARLAAGQSCTVRLAETPVATAGFASLGDLSCIADQPHGQPQAAPGSLGTQHGLRANTDSRIQP